MESEVVEISLEFLIEFFVFSVLTGFAITYLLSFFNNGIKSSLDILDKI